MPYWPPTMLCAIHLTTLVRMLSQRTTSNSHHENSGSGHKGSTPGTARACPTHAALPQSHRIRLT